MHDVMTNVKHKRIVVGENGFVELLDCMPRLVSSPHETADYAVADAARVGRVGEQSDRNLIRFMMRNRHTTPFEMVEFKFHAKMPIFVARQWIRQRTANVNEITGRYNKVVFQDYYIPTHTEVRRQSVFNKQGGDEAAKTTEAQKFIEAISETCRRSFQLYEAMIEAGVSGEQARMLLPLNTYTEWYWKCDLHNLLHFLALRCDSHAQAEMRAYAEAMLTLVTPIVPECISAWNDYHPMRDAMTLTRLEIAAIRNGGELSDEATGREKREWEDKKKRLGL